MLDQQVVQRTQQQQHASAQQREFSPKNERRTQKNATDPLVVSIRNAESRSKSAREGALLLSSVDGVVVVGDCWGVWGLKLLREVRRERVRERNEIKNRNE